MSFQLDSQEYLEKGIGKQKEPRGLTQGNTGSIGEGKENDLGFPWV
jgi:hypothetical protein